MCVCVCVYLWRGRSDFTAHQVARVCLFVCVCVYLTDALLQQANKTASQSEVAARLDHTLMARDKTKALFNGSEHKTPHVEPRASMPNEDSDFALASLGVQVCVPRIIT